MTDERLQAVLNHIVTLEKKQIEKVVISFENLLDVVRHPQQEGFVVPKLEIFYKE